MNPERKKEIEKVINQEIKSTILAIDKYKELTKPISPENSIGRVSRMDAINNKSVFIKSGSSESVGGFTPSNLSTSTKSNSKKIINGESTWSFIKSC